MCSCILTNNHCIYINHIKNIWQLYSLLQDARIGRLLMLFCYVGDVLSSQHFNNLKWEISLFDQSMCVEASDSWCKGIQQMSLSFIYLVS